MRQILGLRAAVSVVTAAGALLILSPIVPGFDVGGLGPALAAAAISGLLNGLLWPILARIALPLTVLTIGGAALVLNGAMLLLVAAIVPAMTIDGLGTAIVVTLSVTALSTLVAAALSIDDDARFASHLAAPPLPPVRPDPQHRARRDVPGDRRPRPRGAAARAARRPRADAGELDRRRRPRADPLGDRLVLADRRLPGRDPARRQRGHAGLPLVGEGARRADRHQPPARRGRAGAPGLRRPRAAARRRRQPREHPLR